jgi:GNAT superfamily N-acetyltransferase
MTNSVRPEGVPPIRPVRADDRAEWLRMRTLLWPDAADGEHAGEIAAFLGTGAFGPSEPVLAWAVLVAVRPDGGLCGFLEVSLRPFAEGCETRPVGYVEGWFVDADVRRHGIGRWLVAAAEEWAAGRGCKEMASDAHPENTASLAAHRALGFEEVSRAVHLRKRLPSAGDTDRPWTLAVLDGVFAVCRLGADVPIPTWATAGGLFSVSRTADELSVVCRQEAVPDGVRCERGWRCLRVAGTIPFTAVGVLAALTAPLADAEVSVFAISTFDTDYLLVKERDLAAAVAALHRRGYSVR